ncbi:hypothetical protein L6R52_26120 [Myxococcota bacterium]|nr:hypothetical protein [Myxococcota bacterium]
MRDAEDNPVRAPVRASYRRREVMKLGAIGASVGLPAIMTLVPRTARATGSWQSQGGSGAQGSWQCGQSGTAGAQGSWQQRCGSGNGTSMQRSRDFRTRMEEGMEQLRYEDKIPTQQVFPGSHEWRMRRAAEEETKRRAQGELGRFGSDDDWR